MIHFHDEIRIDAPVEHVWKFLCDTSRLHDWMTGEELSEFSGPLDQVGTTFVSTSRMLGHEMKGTLAVVEVEPLRLIHLRSDFPMDAFYRFELPYGSRTQWLRNVLAAGSAMLVERQGLGLLAAAQAVR